MAVIRSAGLCVLGVAVALGTVGRVKPELFLTLPGPFGFLLYHIVGGKLLPPYFDTTPFVADGMSEWVRAGDVIVASGAKTGTTWLCYCSDAVRRKGSDDVGLPYTDIMMTTPWMDMSTRPGETWAERKHLYNSTVMDDGTKLKDYWDNSAFPFRIFKSHFLPRGSQDPHQSVLPVRESPGVKFISAMRKPDEYIKSIFHFFPNHHPNFSRMWGGFPPSYDTLDATINDHLPGQPLEGLYLAYVKAWWAFRNDPNVLLLHYSDMVKDLDGLVSRLAAFLGVELSPSEHEAVKQKCSFKHMSEKADLFNYKLLFGSDKVAGTDTVMQSGLFMAKDNASKMKAEASPEALKLWKDALERELAPELLQWLRTGGQLPK